MISYATTSGFAGNSLSRAGDYVLWYAKDGAQLRYRQLFQPKDSGTDKAGKYIYWDDERGERQTLSAEERANPKLIPPTKRLYAIDNLVSQGFRANTTVPFTYREVTYVLPQTQNWKTTVQGLERLAEQGRLVPAGRALMYKRYLDDFPAYPLNNMWDDTGSGASQSDPKVFVVQTRRIVVERCLLMTTDPGDMVLDITCGSGTTAVVAEQWGRRWMTCDTSRVALTLARQRLMTAVFDYYQLAHPDEGIGSGLRYKTVPHVTLKSIANHEPPVPETLYDQPLVDSSRVRVTGLFTVEAVPAPVVMPIQGEAASSRLPEDDRRQDAATPLPADASIARSGETLRQDEWRRELLRTGIRGKSGQFIHFSRVEPLPGTRWLHADAETRPNDLGADRVAEGAAGEVQRAVISFGPEHAPLEQKQVELAIEEARSLVPKPKIIVFAAFQFDPEAAKDIDETRFPGVTLLKAQMNADLLTEDLKKKRASNESFWLIGQPDVEVRKVSRKGAKAQSEEVWQVEVRGFDYYNTKTGAIESGDSARIAVWLLDTDYDGRSLFPRQVFFPMAGEKEGWAKLAKNLKAEIDEELIEAYRGTESLPFTPGKNRRVAVKIVDDRGIESLRIINLQTETNQ